MVSKAIIGHIKKRLMRGVSLEDIKKNLINQGLPLAEINKAIAFSNQGGDVKKIAESEPLTKKRIKYNTKIFIGIIFVIVFVIALVLVLHYTSKPVKSIFTVDEFNMFKGVYLDMSQTSEVSFTLNEQEYFLIVDSVEENSACISGYLGENCFFVGDEKSFDLDGDMNDDLLLKLDKIEDKVATLYFQKQGVAPCSESWNCSEWSICINGFKKRVCVDANYCGTSVDKPITKDICSNDSQSPYQTPENVLDCGISNGSFVNECFLNAAEDCINSKMIGFAYIEEDPILATFELNVSTNFSSYMEIGGPDENNTCVFYEEIFSYSQSYTSDFIQSLLNSGNYTIEEILQQEIDLNESSQEMVGAWNLCIYNQEGLMVMLNDYSENPLGNLDCTVEVGAENPEYTLYNIECVYENITLVGECASGQK